MPEGNYHTKWFYVLIKAHSYILVYPVIIISLYNWTQDI